MNWQELPEKNEVWRIEGECKGEYEKDKNVISDRVQDFLLNQISEDELKRKYELGKNYAKWVVDNKNKINFDENKIIPLAYRPFDTRYTYFDTDLVWRVRDSVTKHFLKDENLGLVTNRQVKADDEWQHIFISSSIVESSLVSNKTGEIGSLFPLYLYDDFGGKIPNLKKEIWHEIEIRIRIKDSPLEEYPTLVGGGVLTSSANTRNFNVKANFTKTPRPPLVSTPQEGNFGDVYISENQYFGNVPEVAWKFYIGGYQPDQKY
jgi:hypothetical protein